jgi:hypothetical protein
MEVLKRGSSEKWWFFKKWKSLKGEVLKNGGFLKNGSL